MLKKIYKLATCMHGSVVELLWIKMHMVSTVIIQYGEEYEVQETKGS